MLRECVTGRYLWQNKRPSFSLCRFFFSVIEWCASLKTCIISLCVTTFGRLHYMTQFDWDTSKTTRRRKKGLDYKGERRSSFDSFKKRGEMEVRYGSLMQRRDAKANDYPAKYSRKRRPPQVGSSKPTSRFSTELIMLIGNCCETADLCTWWQRRCAAVVNDDMLRCKRGFSFQDPAM